MANSANNRRISRPSNGERSDSVSRELREKLAELEHEQWCDWSRSVAATETLAPERLEAWTKRWVPYSELSEADKDMDREYADRVLALLMAEPGTRHEGHAS